MSDMGSRVRLLAALSAVHRALIHATAIADDAKRFDLADELLELRVYIADAVLELSELRPQHSRRPSTCEDREDLPF